LLQEIRSRLRSLANPADAEFAQRYFKTGPGQYGEGDRFLGIRATPMKALAREAAGLSREDLAELLRSEWHEERMLALLVMVGAHKRGGPEARQSLHEMYLAHTDRVNNWDLVDGSAQELVGAHLADGDDLSLLDRLAASPSLWERRIAIIATQHFIRAGEYAPTLHVAGLLVDDRHDLIHKAVGWMLREVGNRDREVEEGFLRAHFKTMPRTMLRYAIERFPEPLRQQYLRGTLTV
jgi:3-methyladenine DNA glycosylase AlkD